MSQCGRCGADQPEDAAWCVSCALVRPPDRPTLVAGDVPGTYSRWGRSSYTFGPVGRVLVTLVLLLPVLWMLLNSALTLLTVGIPYTFVLLPWALRDVWARARVSVRK